MKSSEIKRMFALLLCLVMVFASVSEVFAANNSTKATTLRLTKYEGDITITNASGKTQKTKTDMKLYSGYTVKTSKKGVAYISLDDKKAIKLDNLTEVEVRKSGKKLEVYLSEGNLFFNVSEKLSSDESLNIRTNTMVTGIRGTAGDFAVENGKTTMVLVDGTTEIFSVGSGESFKLEAGNKVTFEETPVTPIPKTEEEITDQDKENEQDQQSETQQQNTPKFAVEKVEDIVKELSASAAEEIANDNQLSERVALTFEFEPKELVNQIEEALPEKKAQAEKKAEEKAVAEEKKVETQQQFVEKLGEASLTTESLSDTNKETVEDYAYYIIPIPTPTPDPDPTPAAVSYKVSLPENITTGEAVIITFAAIDNQTSVAAIAGQPRTFSVSEGAIFKFTVELASGASITSMSGASSADGITYQTAAITTDTAISCEYSYTAPKEPEKKFTVTLPQNITSGTAVLATFSVVPLQTGVLPTPSDREYKVTSGTAFKFDVTSVTGVALTISGINVTVSSSTETAIGSSVRYTTDPITTDTAISCEYSYTEPAKPTPEAVSYKVTLPENITTGGAVIATFAAVADQTSVTAIHGSDREFSVSEGAIFKFTVELASGASIKSMSGASSTDGITYQTAAIATDTAISCEYSYTAPQKEIPSYTVTLPENIATQGAVIVTFAAVANQTSVTAIQGSGREFSVSEGAIFKFTVELASGASITSMSGASSADGITYQTAAIATDTAISCEYSYTAPAEPTPSAVYFTVTLPENIREDNAKITFTAEPNQTSVSAVSGSSVQFKVASGASFSFRVATATDLVSLEIEDAEWFPYDVTDYGVLYTIYDITTDVAIICNYEPITYYSVILPNDITYWTEDGSVSLISLTPTSIVSDPTDAGNNSTCYKVKSGETFSFKIQSLTSAGITASVAGLTPTATDEEWTSYTVSTETAIKFVVTIKGVDDPNEGSCPSEYLQALLNNTNLNEISICCNSEMNDLTIPESKAFTVSSNFSFCPTTITNYGTLNVYGNICTTSSPAIANYGTINIASGASIEIDSITNNGTLNITNGASLKATSILNYSTGTVNATSGTSIETSSITNHGTLNTDGTIIITSSDIGTDISGATLQAYITNSGTFNATSNSAIKNVDSVENNGTFNTKGTLTANTIVNNGSSTFTISGYALCYSLFTNNNTLNVDGYLQTFNFVNNNTASANISDTLIVGSGQAAGTIETGGSDGVVTNSGIININGYLYSSSIDNTGNGQIYISTGAAVTTTYSGITSPSSIALYIIENSVIVSDVTSFNNINDDALKQILTNINKRYQDYCASSIKG